MSEPENHIEVRDLTIAFGSFVVQRELNFTIRRGDIFIIMGPSGCGKSSLLKVMTGLLRPAAGDIFYSGRPYWSGDDAGRQSMLERMGVLFQSGALWSSMTLAENVALPLRQRTDLSSRQIAEICSWRLSLVGLTGFEDYYPNEISGGMRKRAGLARAMALDPEILFFDEPSAGLDPVSARLLDDLILELRDSLGTTIVVVTHELASIFAIGNNGVFLDTEKKTQLAVGKPTDLRDHCEHESVRRFLAREAPPQAGLSGAAG